MKLAAYDLNIGERRVEDRRNRTSLSPTFRCGFADVQRVFWREGD